MTANSDTGVANDAEFTTAVLRNAFQLWFEPEIKRRQEAGSLPTAFPLWGAQVLLEVGKPAAIYFNDQMKGVLEAELTPETGAMKQGDQVTLDHVGAIRGIHLTSEHANAGHLTTIVTKGVWYLLFDFRYNAARIARHLDVARQFLAAARSSFANEHLHVSVDNLFACVELAAKSYLLMLPDESVLQSRRHGFVATNFNRHGGKLGNVDSRFVELFNTLAEAWTKARYPDDALPLGKDRITEWLRTAEEMVTDLDSRRPRRFGESTPPSGTHERLRT